jgi:hypothetical protein
MIINEGYFFKIPYEQAALRLALAVGCSIFGVGCASEAPTEEVTSISQALTACPPGDQATCNWMGACNSAGNACVCTDPQHWWASENCSTWHAGPQSSPDQACAPGDQAFCNWMGACNSTGSGCTCSDAQHWWSSERCSVWHDTAEPTVTAITNVARGKPATWSSSTGSSEDGSKAVDGSTTTRWSSPSTSPAPWLEVDLQSNMTIQRWVVKHSSAGGDDHKAWNTKDFTLSTWNGSAWQAVDHVTDNGSDITDRSIPSTTGRRFRLTVNNGGSDGVVRIYELELYTGRLNLSYGAPATANSNVPGEGPNLASDGSVSRVVDQTSNFVTNSKWCSTSSGDKWLQLDLGANTNVTRWVVHHAGAGGENPDWNTRNFRLEGKVAGGSSFVTLDTVVDNRANTTTRDIPLAKYRYYRLYITNAGSDNAARIYDFQLYGVYSKPANSVPMTWKEGGWPWHNRTLSFRAGTDQVAVFFDSDMVAQDSGDWLRGFVEPLWNYQRKIYGTFGPTNQLWVFGHKSLGRWASSPHWSSYKAYHSVSDVSFDTIWNSNNPNAADLMLFKHFVTHEMGHFVECSSNSVEAEEGRCSVANQWGDSKFMEIFQYDLYRGAGYTAEAADAFSRASASSNTVNGIPPNTTGVHWFNDFFYPIYRDHGGAQTLARYWQLTRQYFPKDGSYYSRPMTFGEMLHFMSGAARTALRTPGVGNGGLAYVAFNKPWDPQWDTELAQAQAAFPDITY